MEKVKSNGWNGLKCIAWLMISLVIATAFGFKLSIAPSFDGVTALCIFMMTFTAVMGVGRAMVFAIRGFKPELYPLEKGEPLLKFFPYITSMAFWDLVVYGHEVFDCEGHPIDDGEFRPGIYQTGLGLQEANDKMCAIYEIIREKGAIPLKMPDGSVWCCHIVQMCPSEENFDCPPHSEFAKSRSMFDSVTWSGDSSEFEEDDESEGEKV